MKKSEFKKWFDREIGGGEQSFARLVRMVEEEGVEWEPEEPKLPKLLLIHAGAVVEDTGIYHIVAAPREDPGRTERNAAILAAMVAAYNMAAAYSRERQQAGEPLGSGV